jgi:F0F1-type ATP synthase membrane subunit b/b'
VDEAKDAIENAAGSFEDGTEWWRTADGWLDWLETEGAAVIVAVLSILGTIYIGISPVLNKVVKSGQRFEGATATADAVAAQTAQIKEQYEGQLREMREQNNAMLEQYKQGMAAAQAEARAAQERCDATLSMMREQYAGVRDDVQRLQRREGDLARMIMIGFGENEELVRRGSAAKIAEIGGAMENEQGTKA